MAVGVGPGSETGFPPLPVQQPPFGFIAAAPDPEFLAGGQGVGQAGQLYGAAGTDGFGPLDFCGSRPDREENLGV
jgi:hypothetical protein